MFVRRSPHSLSRPQGHASAGIALLVALSALAGCSGGGGSTGTVTFSCAGTNPQAICLESCNLGCSATGCSRTDIAQNEIIIFQFSEDIDPGSVSPSSIRFRTASGEQPVGEFFVNGRQVEFVPTLSISGGQTFFGFSAGDTYTLTIPGGDTQPAVVRSTSGKPFAKTLTCTVQSTLGIVDLNGVAPRATLVVPTQAQLASAPRDTDIVLEFNEMIDATPFLSGTQSPVTFSVRRNRAAQGGGYECNPNSAPQTLAGTQRLDFDAGRGISILSFRPVQILPGNVCIEINVTDGVSDLSGRPAQPQTLTFLTEVVPLVDAAITEEFDNDTNLDVDASAASWAGGAASFFQIGGDGRHGVWTTALATDTLTTVEGKRLFTMNTDLTVIPASNTTTGSSIAVTDGRFYFSTMVVPSDVRLRFLGSKPPILTVAGRFDILGHIDVAGVSNTTLPLSSVPLGQNGGTGGAGGGSGGKGGDKITSTQAISTGTLPVNHGSHGQDARVLAGHGYGTSVFNTGGRGSTVFPASGLNSSIYYGTTTGVPYSPSASAGGGGGGFLQPGGVGRVVTNNHPEVGFPVVSTAGGADTVTVGTASWAVNAYAGRTVTVTLGVVNQTRTVVSNTSDTMTVTPAWTTVPAAGSSVTITPRTAVMGPDANGGTALQLFPFPVTPGLSRASDHFLVGGSGGGGGASHPCLSLGIGGTDRWAPGGGGGGGGGAVALRAGNSLRVGPGGKIVATGGSAANSSGVASGAQACVAGGGSGGSIVMQSGNLVEIGGAPGSISVVGGLGGVFNRSAGSTPPAGASVQIAGGNGANGFVRLETPTLPPLSLLASMQPAATAENVGVLTERDDLVVCGSKFYSTGQIFGPEFARYEIYGTSDGVPFVLSDDPAVSTQQAQTGAPVRALFQAGQLDLVTNEPQQIGPWRTSVRSDSSQTGIDADAFNGFRFKLFADYTLGSVITVDKVVVVYRL